MKNALSSSLERPFQTFDAKELYPLAEQKAACLIESILINHPFIDGNKRTGYLVMRLFLVSAGFDIIAAEEEKYSFVISIASGRLKYDEILNWLKLHLIKLDS